VLTCLALACGGCASINEAWMKSYVAIHDAADVALSNKPTVVVSADTNKPVVVNHDHIPDATKMVESNDIKPFTGRYSSGAKSTEYGEEIWIHNWNRLNVRIHANAGELKGEGIPTQGPWYPILATVIPQGTVTLLKTTDGCALTARDFVSSSGQAYRFEGWRCDGLGVKMQKVYMVTLSAPQMYGACFAWYSTVEK